MARQTYVNLAIKDVTRSKEFFTHLGFAFEPRFSNENAACMIINESTFVMLLAEPFFQTFTKKQICDAKTSTEVLVCLSCESRAEVDSIVAAAVAAGGSIPREPEDRGFMYGHAFQDLDGHLWELIFMETSSDAPA
ncbi:MAG TPA: VOC family protein [Candidatus Limnocylindrales bacterium]|nr:VOC family protein [Candidatus Limnocylindrales bacterium]